MASQRINSSFGIKAVFIFISTVIAIIIISKLASKDTETKVVAESDDQSEDQDLEPTPTPPPPMPILKPKSKADNLPNEGEGSSPPKKDKDEEFIKAEMLWLKIMKLIDDKDLEAIKNMIKLDPELVTGPIFQDRYFIHIACLQGYTDLVVELINQGCNVKVTTKDSLEIQPIHFAAELENTEILEKLVEKGAEIDATDINGDTPLMYAVICEQPEPVKYLLTNGANPNLLVSPRDSSIGASASDDEADDDTPVHVKTILNTAISLDHKEIVDLLLANKADPTLVDSLGLNALHTAAFYGREEIVDSLLASGKVNANVVVAAAGSKFAGKRAVDLAKDQCHAETHKKLLAVTV